MRRHAFDRDIIHAGMFFGDILPGLASALAPGRTIYGFEPNPENFVCAQWTALLNALTNVVIHNVGLGEVQKSGRMRMFEHGRAIGGGSHIIAHLCEAEEDNADMRSVKIVVIDEIVPSHADVGIIQLDIEGYEKFALLGGLTTIRKCRPIIILETVPKEFVDEYLYPIGYKVERKVCDNTVFIP